MAKLSARGRTELIRLARSTETRFEVGPERRRVTVALMSDRTVLEKIDISWADAFAPGGERKVSKGWRVIGRNVRADVTPAQFAAVYEAKGYTQEAK